MGNVLCCKPCEVAGSNSVFTFSEDLVLKITEGIKPPPPKSKGKSRDMNDREWMEKIECIDNVHSNAFDLHQEGFNKVFNRLAKTLADTTVKEECEKDDVQTCYVANPDCSLKCNEIVGKFIDCVDMKRLQRMQKHI